MPPVVNIKIMNKDHPGWEKFRQLLNKVVFGLPHCPEIRGKPFEQSGGYCDCEVLLNVK